MKEAKGRKACLAYVDLPQVGQAYLRQVGY